MKYPQLVSSNAISAISDWLVYKLDELGVDAPVILVFSRFLLSLLANHADFLDVRREAVESLKQVSSTVENKETEIAQLIDQLHLKLKKVEDETTLSASISFEPFSNGESHQQSQKEQTIVEEDPEKKYYMAFPALDKNGNSDDYVSKAVSKSMNWSSIINIRSEHRIPIQANKNLKTKRKRNYGRGKLENKKKNASEPEPILWDMDFIGKDAWEMGANLYDDYNLKTNIISNITLEPSQYAEKTMNSKKIRNLEFDRRCKRNDASFASPAVMQKSNGNYDSVIEDYEKSNENQQMDIKNVTDPFEINESFCDSQNLRKLKSKFDSKVRALWEDMEENSEFRFHDSEKIIQNLAISLQLLQNNGGNNDGGSNTNLAENKNLSSAKQLEQANTHDFIKYGTNLNNSIWSDSGVPVFSANQSMFNQDIQLKQQISETPTQKAFEWPDSCVMEVLHSIDVVTTQPEQHSCSISWKDSIEETSLNHECKVEATRKMKIPLVEVTLPNHSANSRFSEVVPSFFREASYQTMDTKRNSSKQTINMLHGSELGSNENLLTSEHTHFRPIKFPISPYIDGYSFRVSSSPIKLEGMSRSETGSLYIDTKKYMEYKKSNTDQNPHHLQKQDVEEFFIKFQVSQNEKFCQTDSEYYKQPEKKFFDIPKNFHDTDVGFWRMDNFELQQEPCNNNPVNGLLKAETDMDGDEIMSDLSFIQNLYIGNDWNNYEIGDVGPVNETTNEYCDQNYEYNIVYDLLKPETTKTLKKMLNQQVLTTLDDEPSFLTIVDDYRFMEEKLNKYNNSICYHKVTNCDYTAETGRRKRRYSECRKDKFYCNESVKVLPFVQDSIALENFITCKFWTTNFTIFNQNNNDNNNYSELFIRLSNRPLTR